MVIVSSEEAGADYSHPDRQRVQVEDSCQACRFVWSQSVKILDPNVISRPFLFQQSVNVLCLVYPFINWYAIGRVVLHALVRRHQEELGAYLNLSHAWLPPSKPGTRYEHCLNIQIIRIGSGG